MLAYVYIYRQVEPVRSGSLYQNLTLLYGAHFAQSPESMLKNTEKQIEMRYLVLFTFIFITGLREWVIMKLFRNLIFCGSVSLFKFSFLSHFDLKQICCTLPRPRQLAYNAVCTL